MNKRHSFVVSVFAFSVLLADERIGAQEIRGKVVRVLSGDTLTLRTDKERIQIRLDCVDAPESGQSFGVKARDALRKLVGTKEVSVIQTSVEGQTVVGMVLIDGKDVNASMVEEGWAWVLKGEGAAEALSKLEIEAREAKRGLWAEVNPTPPWEYRKASVEKGAARKNDDDPIKKRVKADVEAMNNALINDDFETILALTHPKAVELSGGKKAMMTLIETQTADMKSKGIVVQSAEVLDPSDPVTSGSEMFIVAPHNMQMKVPGGKMHVKAFAIGVSGDEGKSWKYVNGGIDLKTIKIVLPNLPDELKLPEKKKPVVERD